MNFIKGLLRPSQVASAHCDGPCGVYDPASARIAAEAVLSMAKNSLHLKVTILQHRTRGVAI